jgi:hypothetical protein
MSHDETRFPDPMSFKPDRHLSSTGELIQGSAPPTFGFGMYAPKNLLLNADKLLKQTRLSGKESRRSERLGLHCLRLGNVANWEREGLDRM